MKEKMNEVFQRNHLKIDSTEYAKKSQEVMICKHWDYSYQKTADEIMKQSQNIFQQTALKTSHMHTQNIFSTWISP